jgi:hypothetical protein
LSKPPPMKADEKFGLIAAIIIAGILIFGVPQITGLSTPVDATKPPKPPPPPPSPCIKDWKACSDNADMANNWSGWIDVRLACKRAANDMAKYGDPEWPSWGSFFITFNIGDDYPKTGKVTAVEKDAKFTNMFNAKVRSQVVCEYDLNTKKVLDVRITER